jgi:hypothetical protein
MRLVTVLLLAAGLLLTTGFGAAQPPDGKKGSKATQNDDLITYMMSFNKKKDGKLTKEELTDKRLHRLFDQADTDKDGVVTVDELKALVEKFAAEEKKWSSGPGKFGPFGPGGFGPGGFGPGGPGKFGPPQPGQVLPSFVKKNLDLTADQMKQLDALQKEVDAQLDKILTPDQKKQLKALQKGGPGGFGPPGGPGGGGPPG